MPCFNFVSSCSINFFFEKRYGYVGTSFDTFEKDAPQPEMITVRAELPVEYKDLDDEELKDAISEENRNDGRIDRHELYIIYKKGVIFLN